jgi:hypothetical protein
VPPTEQVVLVEVAYDPNRQATLAAQLGPATTKRGGLSAIRAPREPQPPQAPLVESIFCYRTVLGAQLASQAQAIARAVFTIGNASSESRMFWLTPDNERIGYADGSGMFQAAPGNNLPSSAEEAQSICRQFVQRINTALGKDGTLAALKTDALLPADMQLLNATPVYHPIRLDIDHWLCRFVPTLRSRSSLPPAQVSEGTLEMRVGSDARMLSLVAQWQPIAQQMLCSPIGPPDPRDLNWTAEGNERRGSEPSGVEESGSARLIYAPVAALSGESWLLPYYVFDADPLQRRYRAAEHQLSEQPQANQVN